MRQRIKRRVFLMSMALATGASGSALAKGGKQDGDEFFTGDARAAGKTSVSYPGYRGHPDPDSPDPVGKLQGWLGGLGYGAETAAEAGKGWRLEMLPAQDGQASASDARPVKNRPFGLAVRLAF